MGEPDRPGLQARVREGGATRGGREVEGGLHLTDSSLQPIPRAASLLSSLLGSVLRPTFSSSTPHPSDSLLCVPPRLPSPTLRANHCWKEAGAAAAGSCGALRRN